MQFDFEAIFRAKIEELKRTFDCRKCRECLFKDCKLAINFRAHQMFSAAAERRREQEAWAEDLRCTTGVPEKSQREPRLEDFESTGEVWGRA